MSYRYTYGPVPSRRLGLSLGVDIIPLKTCTYNCIYCQLEETTNQTKERQSFCDIAELLKEVEGRLRSRPDADYITMSGSGEPTLNRDIGAIIDGIRRLSSKPIAVITNSSLLWRPDVRAELSKADLVIPSLDAGSDDLFRQINRPAEGLEFSEIIEGLRTFTRQTSSRVWIEVMLVSGINDTPEELAHLHEILRGLRLEKVQLNTVIRPPSELLAKPLTPQGMEHVRGILGADLPVEIIASFGRQAAPTRHEDVEIALLDVLRRRPCRVLEISQSLGIAEEEVARRLEELTNRGVVKETGGPEEDHFYILATEKEDSR